MRKPLFALIGLGIGIGAGLFIGWYAWPVTYIEASPTKLRQDWKDEAIWVAAQSFAYDGDLEAAQARLKPLGSSDVGQLVLDRAEHAIQQKMPAVQITYLARLAAAFGARSAQLEPYLTP